MKFHRLLLGFLCLFFVVSGPSSMYSRDSEAGYVNFNFDRVDTRLLIKLVGEMTGRRFVVPDQVDGQVSVVTPDQLRMEEVYPLFLSILEASGYSVIEEGALNRVVQLPARAIESGEVSTGAASNLPEGVITRVIQLHYVNALELLDVIKPLVRGGGTGALSAFGPTNHLIITDTVDAIRKIEQIIQELDREGSSRMVDVITLQHASAEELAGQLMEAMKGAKLADTRIAQHVRQVAEGRGALPSDVVVVPAAHANSILLVGTSIQIQELKRIIQLLDTEHSMARGPLHAIFLKYMSAEEAAKNLKALLQRDGKQNTEIAVEPDVANNALLVKANRQDYEWIEGLVEELDKVPQQVLVEILIAEVSVGHGLDLGVEWSTVEQPSEGDTTIIGRSRPGDTDTLLDQVSQGVFPQGILFGIAKGSMTDANGNLVPRVPFLLRALSEDQDVKILSSVPLWAQNNTEASVSVVENIPVLRSTIEGGSGTARDTIQNIDRMDVGIKLTLTPHVNPDGEVLMDLNPSIEAVVDEGPSGQYAPTIAKREVKTTVTVPDRATIAISGLIREDKNITKSKVPLLGDIPLLGVLFRSQRVQRKRTNLLIFVTPHVVTDITEANAVRRQWETRTQISGIATGVAVRTAVGE